jgi:hypothetical protein
MSCSLGLVPKTARSQRLHVDCEQVKTPPRPKSKLAKMISGVAGELDRIYYPVSYVVSIDSDDETTGAVVDFHVRAGLIPGVSVRSIELVPRARHPRASDLRLPLGTYLEVVEHVVSHGVITPAVYEIRDGTIMAPDGTDIRARVGDKPSERRRALPLNEKDMREIARVYRENPRRPKKAVAEARRVSESTAARMIGQARAAGFLGPALPNRAGEATPPASSPNS